MSSTNQAISIQYFQSRLYRFFDLKNRNSSITQEIIAGITTFLAMIYSVVVVPDMLGSVGFDKPSSFISVCLVTGIGSLMMGFWANLPMAVGCAISLSAFTAFGLVLGQKLSLPVALGLVFWMGVVFTLVSLGGIRRFIITQLPKGIACGIGIGIGLFLLLIAANNVGITVNNPEGGLPITGGGLRSFPVLMSLLGLGMIFGFEQRKWPGGMLIAMSVIAVLGRLFDPNVVFSGFFALPQFNSNSATFLAFDPVGALSPGLLPLLFAMVITALFDATGTMRAVANEAGLINPAGDIEQGKKGLMIDSCSSILAGVLGTAPAAVYIESAAGTSAGGRTGLTAVTVGLLFLLTLFLSPLSALIPSYATAPALMYVGILMLGNVIKLDPKDAVDTWSGLGCAVFIMLTTNIVTGITMGLIFLVIGRIFSGEWRRLNWGIVILTLLLCGFYIFDLAL